MEVFALAFGLEGHYEVSNYGNLRRSIPGKGARHMRNFATPKRGYHTARICINGIARTVAVHRVVVETFLRQMQTGECVNHLDGDKLNNRLTNLEITSTRGNARHAVDVLGFRPRGMPGQTNAAALLTQDQADFVRDADLGYGGIKRLAGKLGVKPSTLYAIRAGRNWRQK